MVKLVNTADLKSADNSLAGSSPARGTKTKHCPKCNQTKTVRLFYRRKDTKDGYFTYCKACHTENQKLINEKNKEIIKKSKARRYTELKLGKIIPQSKDRFPKFGKFWSNAPMRILFPTIGNSEDGIKSKLERINQVCLRRIIRKDVL